MYEEGSAMGNAQAALSQIEGVYREADSQMQNALGNLDGAIQYILDAQNKNPNRLSLLQNNTSGVFAVGRQQQQQPNPFGQPTTTTTAFGAPSAGGFGAPTATPAAGGGGFGQPSTLGQKPSAFGAPAFGQAAQPAAGGFGQPSALGQKPSAFGTPAFGQSAQPTSAFGQPSKPGGAFGQPAFGQPAAPAFGQSTPMGGAAAAGGFGQPSALGQKPSPFGSAAAAAGPSPFGGNAAPRPSSQQQQQQQQQQLAGAPAAAAAGPGPYAPNATRQHPPASSYITKNPDGTVAAFKGKAVSMQTPREGSSATKPFPVMRAFDGSVTRIWNPDGAPAYYKDTEAPPEAYDAATRAAYEAFVNTGKFQGGIMPETPPLREWCTWDF
ncbi:CCCH zinc finger domain-containing protein, variant [Magnaporthiopsis poae ATCC 64411]|nr:CCCH zinc finger domain-containing protein, variant [Magnaporthiopsis poae ATCC 64411]